MKKVLSVILVLILVSGIAYAEGNEIFPDINITQNESVGKNFKLEIEWSVQDVKQGGFFDLEFPISINLPDNEYADIIDLGNNSYRLVFKDDFESVTGQIGGSKTFTYEENLKPIIVNGEIVYEDYNTPEIEQGEVDDNTVRDRIYKMGFVDGTKINWELVIGGDKQGINPNTGVRDEIGDGHKLDVNSVEFIWYVGENGKYIDENNTEIIDNVSITENGIDFDLSLATGEYILIKYKTIVTDFDRLDYSNQVMVEDERKVSETVKVDSWGNIDGNKLKPEPEEPENPPTLPQVGESYFKIEYLIGIILMGLAFYLRKSKIIE